MDTSKIILFIAGILMLVLSAPGLATQPPLKDDAYHYQSNGIDDYLFTEWWYFNGISNDTQFLFSYFITDPENKTVLENSRVLAVFFDNPPKIGISYGGGFFADHNVPVLRIGESSLEAIDNSTYRISGICFDIMSGEPLEWNLTYTSLSAPWPATTVPMSVGHLINDWMMWLVYMPSARVSGTISLNNITRNVSGVGYHDHNWGRWAFNDPQWNWAQASSPADNFSITLGDVIGPKRNTILRVTYSDIDINFTYDQINLSYDDFDFDPTTARLYPVAYTLRADDGEYQLESDIVVLKYVPLIASYPKPMPTYVIFEQLSQFQGALKSENKTLYQFDVTGFTEYTTHKLHTIFGKLEVPDLSNTTIVATNNRTEQSKVTSPGTSGYFSIDADFSDYLNNSRAPWVADGDDLVLEVKDTSGRYDKINIKINTSLDGQEVPVKLPNL